MVLPLSPPRCCPPPLDRRRPCTGFLLFFSFFLRRSRSCPGAPCRLDGGTVFADPPMFPSTGPGGEEGGKKSVQSPRGLSMGVQNIICNIQKSVASFWVESVAVARDAAVGSAAPFSPDGDGSGAPSVPATPHRSAPPRTLCRCSGRLLLGDVGRRRRDGQSLAAVSISTGRALLSGGVRLRCQRRAAGRLFRRRTEAPHEVPEGVVERKRRDGRRRSRPRPLPPTSASARTVRRRPRRPRAPLHCQKGVSTPRTPP